MLEKELCRESKRPVILRDWLRYKAGFRRAHPDYFDPDGLAIFVGGQGTGKTLSAVNYVYKLLDAYPHAKLVTNVALADYPIVTFFEWFVNQDKTDFIKDGKFEMSEEVFAEYEQRYLAENRVFEFCDNDDFKRYSNGECGVIFFVDEIQLYMNSLESKNINIEVITQISQQRKQRKHIVATSQVFGRMAKPLREQFSSVMLCKNYMGVFRSMPCWTVTAWRATTAPARIFQGRSKRNLYGFIRRPCMRGMIRRVLWSAANLLAQKSKFRTRRGTNGLSKRD